MTAAAKLVRIECPRCHKSLSVAAAAKTVPRHAPKWAARKARGCPGAGLEIYVRVLEAQRKARKAASL